MSKQQITLGIGGFLGLMALILDSKTAFSAAMEGIALCINTLIPSLLPFFIFSIWLTESLSGANMPWLRPIGRLFHLPDGGESMLAASVLGGYPVGAQCVFSAYSSQIIDKQEAQRLLAYCSNAGPAFLFGVVGHMFPDRKSIWILWAIHMISAWMVSCIFLPGNSVHIKIKRQTVSVSQMMYTAIKAMASVCGWVILFRIILGFLNRWILWIFPIPMQIILTGILELTNGCLHLHMIENPQYRFIICSGLLAFGGICVTMQTVSVVQQLSVVYYLTGKLLQCLFSVLLAFLYVFGSVSASFILLAVIALSSVVYQKIGGNLEKAVV